MSDNKDYLVSCISTKNTSDFILRLAFFQRPQITRETEIYSDMSILFKATILVNNSVFDTYR
jgi:hypothetical protein